MINLSTPLNTLGFGLVGLNVALALEKLGWEPALFPIGPVEALPAHHASLQNMMARAQFFSNRSPSLRIYHQFSLAEHVGKGPHCAYPFFELDRFRPVEKHHLLSQDIVFAPSEWAKTVLLENGVCDIRLARPGVDVDIFKPSPVNSEKTTTFLNVGKWELRKGHDVLIEAFCKAFEPKDDVRLIMHCFNPCFRNEQDLKKYNNEWISLYQNSKLASKIQIVQGRFESQAQVASLMAHVDCGVFPSRAEGWGLESAEMLSMGRHVILTDYSSHTEYATKANARLIDITLPLEPAHDGIWFKADLPEWERNPGQWAFLGVDQIDQLVEHMRAIHRLKQEGLLGVNQAGIDSMKKFTWENTAAELTAAF